MKRDADLMRRKFIAALIANGGDRKAAALSAGYSQRSAETMGSRLAKHPDVQAALKNMQNRLARKLELQAESVLGEIAAIVHFDIRRLFTPEGALKSVHELDDATAAAVSSVKVTQNAAGQMVTEIKAWDKNTAIGNAMKHLGLFERDNKQQADAAAELMAHVAAHNQALQVANACKPVSLTPRPGTTSDGASATSTG